MVGLWHEVCTLQATFLDFLSFKFCMVVHHGQIYTPIVFGDAILSLVSFVTCWLLSCVRSASHISLVIFFFRFFSSRGAAPNVLPFIGSDVQKALIFYGMTLLFRGYIVCL